MRKVLILAFAIAAASSGAALADARSACKADAQKVCSSSIGDKNKVLSCLKANKDKISDGCKQAIAAL